MTPGLERAVKAGAEPMGSRIVPDLHFTPESEQEQMRTRGLLTSLILTLLGVLASGGCQLFAGLTVLQIDGQGGAGGGDTSSSATSSSGSSGGGEVPCPAPCPMGSVCNLAIGECRKECLSNVNCDVQQPFCITPAKSCDKCGHQPRPPMQCSSPSMGCEGCDPQAPMCVKTCDAQGECEANAMGVTVHAEMEPAKLMCQGQCNNTTVHCMGPYECNIVCDGAGCNNLTVECDPQGPCTLTCAGSGCASVTLKCGANSCVANCSQDHTAQVDHQCGESCGCVNQECH